MNHEKLDNLFGEIRNEATETSVNEVSTWIAVSAGAVGIFGLLSKFKLPFLLTKKLIIMTSVVLSVGIGVTAFLLSMNDQPVQNKKVSVPVIAMEENELNSPKVNTNLLEEEEEVEEVIVVQNEPNSLNINSVEEMPYLATNEVEVFEDNLSPEIIQTTQHESAERISGTEIEVGFFNQVHVNGVFEVFITQGVKASVIADGPADVIENIKAEVNRGELHLRSKKRKSSYKKDKLTFYITMVEITGVGASGASSVKSTMILDAPKMDVQATGASNVDLELNSDYLKIEGTGASNVELSGMAKTIVIEANGAVNLDCFNLKADIVDVVATGAANVELQVNQKMNANATGAANIEYTGSPTSISKSTSISSNISHKTFN